jgi:Putative DNA-binding domain
MDDGQGSARLDASRLTELIEGGHEHEGLDYKRTLGLATRARLLELVKDLAAMSAKGGYIVVGVDERLGRVGVDTGEQRALDEANLRARVDEFLPDIEMRTAIHNLEGKVLGLIWVRRSPLGFSVMAHDGQYAENGKQRTVFREGDVFVRRGTATVRAGHSDMARLRDQLLEASRAQARRELLRPNDGDRAPTKRDRHDLVSGRVGMRSGPGDGRSRLTIAIAASPEQPAAVPTSDQMDELVARVAVTLFGGGFHPRTETNCASAERRLNPDFPDRVSVSASGDIDVHLCAQPPGWSAPGNDDWMIDASQLTADVLACLLFPFALERNLPELVVTPFAVAVGFSGWNGKALTFPRLPRLRPHTPFSSGAATREALVGALFLPRDAVLLAIEAVRRLARFYEQRGADTWAQSAIDDLRAQPAFKGWATELFPPRPDT